MDHVDSSQKIEEALTRAISNGKAELKVELSTKILCKTWCIKSKHHGINLRASIPVGADGKISGKNKEIKLSKKWISRATRFL
ncbi:conserved hypothetical protein [Ricinus communis]|uniref:Uncharacterized protein n=1 Tax=Ricinus communis TaxID=3988 RepID=B9RXS5_RICCO|nr:conserved hypothetical protein [Ricinus communis]